MNCKCISSFKVSNYQFIKDNVYGYRISKHEETGINLYTANIEDDSLTLVEDSFLRKFSDVQRLRDSKIEDLLNER